MHYLKQDHVFFEDSKHYGHKYQKEEWSSFAAAYEQNNVSLYCGAAMERYLYGTPMSTITVVKTESITTREPATVIALSPSPETKTEVNTTVDTTDKAPTAEPETPEPEPETSSSGVVTERPDPDKITGSHITCFTLVKIFRGVSSTLS